MFSSAFFMLAHMQCPHGYHMELAKDFSMAIPCASGFALAAWYARLLHFYLSSLIISNWASFVIGLSDAWLLILTYGANYPLWPASIIWQYSLCFCYKPCAFDIIIMRHHSTFCKRSEGPEVKSINKLGYRRYPSCTIYYKGGLCYAVLSCANPIP